MKNKVPICLENIKPFQWSGFKGARTQIIMGDNIKNSQILVSLLYQKDPFGGLIF